MIKYIFRHNKDYSRYNIIKELISNYRPKNTIYILMPFSKNKFFQYFFKRDRLVNDFFISNYDTYVNDRKKIKKTNPRAWFKFFQDFINFKFSRYLLSDTDEHFKYWETMFGYFKGKHFVLPVLADKSIYYPSDKKADNSVVKILFYGSFAPLHGVDIILNTFKILEDNGIEFEAEIVGSGQTYEDMKTLYKSLNLKNVKMNGEVIKEKNLADKIRDSDIVLGIFGTSKKACSVIPNKVYQGLACRKTVVTMKSSVINEFFSDKDLVQCKNTPESLSETLMALIEDKNRIDEYSKNGYDSFLDLYESTKKKFIEFLDLVGK